MVRVAANIRHSIITWFREGFGARNIHMKLLNMTNHNYSLSTISYILKKWKDYGIIEDRPKSGRPRIARTVRNIAAVRQEFGKNILMQSPKKTPKRLGQNLNISKSSVHCIINLDLYYHPFKQVTVQHLTNLQKQQRVERCRALLDRFSLVKSRRTIFTDETYFNINCNRNRQNHRIYARRKNDIPKVELFNRKSEFPLQILVFCAVSYRGKLPLIFLPPGDTLRSENYQELCVVPTIHAANALYPLENWVWQQDSAPPHRSHSTQHFLQNHTPDFIEHNRWPPSSCDVAVMDYGLFGRLKDSIYKHPIHSLEDLRRWVQLEWNRFPQQSIQNSIDAWRTRMRRVIDNEGEPIRK